MKDKRNSILELIKFLVPRVSQLGYENLVIFLLDVIMDWEGLRMNKGFVELFYETLNFVQWEVPTHLRREALDVRLISRIVDFNSAKPVSFVDLASQLEIDKGTLKKILERVDPLLAARLKGRKKLSMVEMLDLCTSMGFFELLEDESIDEPKIFKKSELYNILNTDKRTLEDNLSPGLKQKIVGLNYYPPSIYKEIRLELDGKP